MKPNAHTYFRSPDRVPGRATVISAVIDRIERIGFSIRLLAIKAACVPQPGENCKYKVVTLQSTFVRIRDTSRKRPRTTMPNEITTGSVIHSDFPH